MVPSSPSNKMPSWVKAFAQFIPSFWDILPSILPHWAVDAVANVVGTESYRDWGVSYRTQLYRGVSSLDLGGQQKVCGK